MRSVHTLIREAKIRDPSSGHTSLLVLTRRGRAARHRTRASHQGGLKLRAADLWERTRDPLLAARPVFATRGAGSQECCTQARLPQLQSLSSYWRDTGTVRRLRDRSHSSFEARRIRLAGQYAMADSGRSDSKGPRIIGKPNAHWIGAGIVELPISADIARVGSPGSFPRTPFGINVDVTNRGGCLEPSLLWQGQHRVKK
jgi:hypothetical protein